MHEKNKIYAVIDTNVVVSSFFSKDGTSNPAIIISSILDRSIVPLYNEEILAEYHEVLSRPEFNFKSEKINDIISAFREYGINANRVKIREEVFPDPDDIVFYEVKMSKEDSYLVTGNLKHFPQNPLVVTPAQMVGILRSRL